MIKYAVAALAVSSIFAGSALADTVKPAIVYDKAGKHDKSFNQGVYEGALRFTKSTGVKFADFEPQNASQFEQGLRNFAQKGYSPILAVGFSMAEALKKVSAEFPKTHFGIIDLSLIHI